MCDSSLMANHTQEILSKCLVRLIGTQRSDIPSPGFRPKNCNAHLTHEIPPPKLGQSGQSLEELPECFVEVLPLLWNQDGTQ